MNRRSFIRLIPLSIFILLGQGISLLLRIRARKAIPKQHQYELVTADKWNEIVDRVNQLSEINGL